MSKVKSVKVEKDPENDLRDIVILQQTILDVADYAKKLNNTRLTKNALVILLQDAIGNRRITREQISDVLDAAEDLARKYLKPV